MSLKMVIASQNTGKILELQALVQSFAIELSPQAQWQVSEVPETGATFIENALIKARHAASCTQMPALADDSGLIIRALDGAPGVQSARYAGEKATAQENIDKVLANLSEKPNEKHDAYFYCVLVFMQNAHDPAPLIAEGKWHGMITAESQGTSGFGYDPIFYLPAENKTAAQLPLKLKNKISHRGLAMQSFISQLAKRL